MAGAEVVPFRKKLHRGSPSISQAELEDLLLLRKNLRLAHGAYDGKCLELLERLLSGASVEPGTYRAAVREIIRRGSRTVRLDVGLSVWSVFD